MNWHWAGRLGDVAQFIRGLTYKPDDVLERDDAGAVPCMRTKNIQEQLEDDDLVYIPDRLVRDGRWLAEGDILVSSANSWNLVGKCSWVPDLAYRATFGGFTSVLRADPRHIYARYLYHWFSWNHTQAVVRSFGQQTTNISNLNHSRCLDLTIPLPPLDEQRRIAAILDKADALRQKRKRAIALLDSLTQSIFLEMFGDGLEDLPCEQLGELTLDARIGLVRSASEFGPQFSIPYVRMDAIGRDGMLHLEGVQYTSATEKEIQAYELRDGDFLFNTRNSRELVGKSAVFYGGRGIVYNNNILRLRLSDRITPEYLASYLRTDRGRQTLEERKSGTTSVFAIYQKALDTLLIPIAPVMRQQEFSDRVRRGLSLRASFKNQEAVAMSLFASLQHRAFSGQL